MSLLRRAPSGQELDAVLHILALTLLLVLAFSICVEWKLSRRGIFPLVSFISAYYFLFYGVFSAYAAHFIDLPPLPFPTYVSFDTAVYICAFVLAQVTGYCAWHALRARPAVRSLPSQREYSPVLVWLAFAFILLHLAFSVFPRLSEVPSLPQLRRPLWDFGFAVLVWLALSGRLTKLAVAALLILTFIRTGLDMAGGLMTLTIFNVLVFALAAICLRRFWPVVIAVAGILVLLSSYGYVKYLSRVILADQPVNVFNFKPDGSIQSLAASVNALARRSAHALVQEQVMELTPSEVPYSKHSPFMRAVTNHMPRVIWPDKPLESMGNSFGRKYGFLDNSDAQTSWNVPWTADFYMAHGRYVALACALAVGVLLGLAVDWMSRRREQVFWFGIYVATIFPLFYQESNFSLMAGSVIWSAMVPIVAYRLGLLLVGFVSRKASA